MSSHILQEIEATVDRIIIIDKGSIVADGTTKKIMKGELKVGGKRRKQKGGERVKGDWIKYV